MAHILRAVLSTGFVGSADRSVSKAAGALSCAFWLQRVVYPNAADNVSRPLPIRLKGVNQPVIRT